MKKKCLVLIMIACILGLTACGSAKAEEEPVNEVITEENASMIVEDVCSLYEQIALQMTAEEFVKSSASQGVASLGIGYQSWVSAKEDIGDIVDVGSVEIVSSDEDEVVLEAKIQGSEAYKNGESRTATMEIVADTNEMTYTSISVNVDQTMGELMTKAALNTLLGMGTVFAVLILISLIISCFSVIPKIQAAFSRKNKQETAKAEAVDNTIAQIVEKEEATDDLELIAVISAAIAASEGQTSTDGFIVRSIIRR